MGPSNVNKNQASKGHVSLAKRKPKVDSVYSEQARQGTGKSRTNQTVPAEAGKESVERHSRARDDKSPEGLKHLKIVEKYIQLEKKFGVKSKSIGQILGI